jgi:hypothetical protein
VDRLAVQFMVQRAIGCSTVIYVMREEVAVSFRLHSELNVLVRTVQMAKEVPQPVGSHQMTKISST